MKHVTSPFLFATKDFLSQVPGEFTLDWFLDIVEKRLYTRFQRQKGEELSSFKRFQEKSKSILRRPLKDKSRETLSGYASAGDGLEGGAHLSTEKILTTVLKNSAKRGDRG